MQHSGEVKKYIADKGYGFLSSDDFDKDVFFHISGLSRDSWDGREPVEGDKVTFTIVEDRGRERADEVTLVGGTEEADDSADNVVEFPTDAAGDDEMPSSDEEEMPLAA